MLRILLAGVVIITILGCLFYWRFISASSKTTSVNDSTQQPDSSLVSEPQEVPAEPPITADVNTLSDLQSQIDSLKKQVDSIKQADNYDTKIKILETSIADIRAQIAKLSSSSGVNSSSTATSATDKYPLYIPLGSAGGPWSKSEWYTLPEYQVVINPSDYSGYTSVELEIILRVIDPT